MFLVIHDVHPRPVDSNDDLVLGEGRAREAICLVESREQERPLQLCIHHDFLFHS